MLKAAAGGGGRGMRRCDREEEVIPAFNLVSGEAAKAFGNGRHLQLKSSWSAPKHDRGAGPWPTLTAMWYTCTSVTCSLQRRFQKVVEFTPAFSVDEKVRQALCDDAVKIAKAVGYVNAGTVEFLVDNQGHHYFIEMNPRIPGGAHCRPKWSTGVDLVRAQLLIASGKPLSDPEIGITCQEDVRPRGYAIQCRVDHRGPGQQRSPPTPARSRPTAPPAASASVSTAATGYSGAEISPYVRLPCWSRSPAATTPLPAPATRPCAP